MARSSWPTFPPASLLANRDRYTPLRKLSDRTADLGRLELVRKGSNYFLLNEHILEDMCRFWVFWQFLERHSKPFWFLCSELNAKSWVGCERVVDHEIAALTSALTHCRCRTRTHGIEPPQIKCTIHPRAFVRPIRIRAAFPATKNRSRWEVGVVTTR